MILTTKAKAKKKSSFKFEDFGVVYEEMQYESDDTKVHEVEGEKLEGLVRWMHYLDKKWVFSAPELKSEGKLKTTLRQVKLLLLQNTKSNREAYQSAKKNATKWTHATFQPLYEENNIYNTLEGPPTTENTPFIISPKTEERITCLGVGLFDTSVTKKKRYRVNILEMLVIDVKTNCIYDMRNVSLKCDYDATI